MKAQKTNGFNRRQFIKSSLGTILAAAVAPQFIPSRLLASSTAPSNKIQLGHIGVGGQGTRVLNNFLNVQESVSLAICDPFQQRRDATGQLITKRTNGAVQPKMYNDFRELLADPSLDAVVIATPDHWHVPIGLAAVRANKDVYIEKPLGKSLNQNRAMLEACRKSGRIFQYGTFQRSMAILHRGIELILNGYIGDLQRIEVWAPHGISGGSLVEIPVPVGLDYDLYLGPAPLKPCTKDRITNRGSYFCSDYALGFIAGWGAHPLDIAIWGMDFDTKGLVKFNGKGQCPTPQGLFDTYSTWDVDIDFAGGVKMRFMSDDVAAPVIKASGGRFVPDGTKFYGSKGWISLSREDYDASDPQWFKQKQYDADKRVLSIPNYYGAFVNSVRDRSPSMSPIEDAVRSDAISHLSLMSIISGKEVVWNPKEYRIESPSELNQQMDVSIRVNWSQT